MFLYHEPCKNCGSTDNMARYRDGSGWCFGCHYHEKATISSYVLSNIHKGRERSEDSSGSSPLLPDDAGTELAANAVRWLGTYFLDVPTAIRRGVLYSPSRDQIIYQLGNVWQARNLRQGSKSKNFTSGNVNECLHIYGNHSNPSRNRHVLVIVEDPVSAIRVAARYDAMPLLGSHLATSRLNAVAGLYEAVCIYLDSDKYKEACDIARRFKLVGVGAKVVWHKLDPKCLTDDELKEVLASENTISKS